VRSLEVRIKQFGRMLPVGMLLFSILPAAFKTFITVDLVWLVKFIMILNYLS
jgi:hypothetical protein